MMPLDRFMPEQTPTYFADAGMRLELQASR
jgi:hypothetical protein